MGAKSKALNDTLVAGLSDIRFTDTNRVPSYAARGSYDIFGDIFRSRRVTSP